ncbi:hypothetical protein [Ammoniphilus oxalaticus]|uniref:hypothetical protein n=1 Tax=Ammoniphilus oxalaticus TaxID=66863 RepID=UPI00147467A1|nr:hypothetical protein [Ammoniphilus oxalaticus]
MKALTRWFGRFIVSYLAILFVIMLLPVFLITPNVPEFDRVMEFLFKNKELI